MVETLPDLQLSYQHQLIACEALYVPSAKDPVQSESGIRLSDRRHVSTYCDDTHLPNLFAITKHYQITDLH